MSFSIFLLNSLNLRLAGRLLNVDKTLIWKNSVRCIRHKPWVPKFRLLRQMQPWDSPIDFYKDGPQNSINENPSELRQRLRRNGLLPPLIFQDRPINIGHTGQVTDPYKPGDGDGWSSFLSFKKPQGLNLLLKKSKSYREVLKIRTHEPTFSPKTFANEVESIYLEAHNLLQNFTENEARLFQLVTEKAFVEMTSGLKFKTLRWKFVATIEPPRVVHVRTQEMLSKDNLFGQITVRMYTQQIIAIYDRFGRLLFGNPNIPIDVLEYIVFEKHITDEYGIWRLHAKIVPPNLSTSKHVYLRTQRLIESTETNLTTQPTNENSTAKSNQ